MAEPLEPSASVALAGLDRPRPTLMQGWALPAIVERNAASAMWTVVADDDPTGTQTVHDVPVVMPGCSSDDLRWASRQSPRLTIALTNTRSETATRSKDLISHLVRRAASVAKSEDLNLRIVLRSDSTLRGHFGAELQAALHTMESSGLPVDGVLFVPCFLEAGRYTAHNVQWVRSGANRAVPAAHTEFARDRTFGYFEEDLRRWVRARQPVRRNPIATLSLETLRGPDGIRRATDALCALSNGRVLIANAMQPVDLEVLMLALLAAERAGRRIVIRCGPSFVRVCAGQSLLDPIAAVPDRRGADDNRAAHGLVVVGSHTGLTNAQLSHAESVRRLITVELNAGLLASRDSAVVASEVQRCASLAAEALRHADVVLRTSRDLVVGGRRRATHLATSRRVAEGLARTVAKVLAATPPRFVVAKGGITSSDVVSQVLRVQRAKVVGQLRSGQLSVWALLDGLAPGLPYVVFPGNVGEPDTLTRVLGALGS